MQLILLSLWLLATHPLAHGVFTKQPLLARAQASAWTDVLEPLYEILSLAGMSTEEAWEWVLIFTKAVFDEIKTVQALTLDKKNTVGSCWGSINLLSSINTHTSQTCWL